MKHKSKNMSDDERYNGENLSLFNNICIIIYITMKRILKLLEYIIENAVELMVRMAILGVVVYFGFSVLKFVCIGIYK